MSLAALNLPSKRQEDWRWTDLSAIEAALSARANDMAPDHRRWLIESVSGPVLVFVDGRYLPEASRPEHVIVGGNVPSAAHPLTDLARSASGIAIRIEAEHATSGPVQLIHIATGGPAHLANRIELAEDAQASIVETYVGAPATWTNLSLDVTLAHSARLMRSVRRLGDGGAHSEVTRADVGQGASFHSALLLSGAEGARVETHVTLTGVGAFAGVDGALLSRGREVLDTVTRVRHEAEGGVSRQTWRSVADDLSTASVAGRVEVARGAQKTDAEQSVKALLLKRTATANAKPELEIFADDVKCAHGATVGELSRDALFYLASRGVPPVEARAILTESFLADALATIGEDAVREALTADAVAWLRRA